MADGDTARPMGLHGVLAFIHVRHASNSEASIFERTSPPGTTTDRDRCSRVAI